MTKNQASTPIKVRIDRILDGDGATRAYASATIAGAFAVHDLRISEKDNKLMVHMPFKSYKQDGVTKYSDVFHAITADARTQLISAVTEAYEQALEQKMAEQERGAPGMSMGM